jgi:glycosyltransferase involved in cell wall biosynthesis
MSLRILQLNSARLYIGEAAHTLNLTEALRQEGHRVWLGLRSGYLTIDVARRRNLEPLGFKMPKRWWLPSELPDMRDMAKLVREEGIQVVHVHRGREHWQATLAAQLFRLGVPIVRTRHVVTPLKKHLANRWLAGRTAKLIVVSRAVEADVRSTRLYRDQEVVFIPGGVDLELFRVKGCRREVRAKVGLAEDALVAICVARFAKVKAHRVLLESWASVRRQVPGAILLLVGDGLLRAESEALAGRLGLTGNDVRFLGWQTSEELPGLLEAADVGVLTSVGSEGFSRAVLEYLSLQLPVVATRVGAVPDLVTDGVSGRLVEPEDVVGLARALTEALQLPPERRGEMGRAGRAKAEGEHGYRAWARAHVRLYEDVLKNRRTN